MPPSRLISASQPDPNLSPVSPTLDAGASPSRAPVRRNLFSAHLSRRPASSQSSQPSNSQPASQPYQQPYSQPIFPVPQPQVLGGPSHTSPFASPPQLHPSFASSYDPTISPNHPLSPKTKEAVFPSGGVIAVHPVTGRPILPNIPTLPRQLRLSDDDEDEGVEEEGEAEEADGQGQAERADLDTDDESQSQHHARAPSVHPYNQPGYDPFASTAAAQIQPHPQSQQHQHQHPTERYVNPATTEQDAEAYEKARYNSQLEDMMSRYRSREYAKNHPKSKAGKMENGADAVDEEKDELMGHLMGVLGREVQRSIEEEGWMFGDPDRGLQEMMAEGDGIVMGGSAAAGGIDVGVAGGEVG